MAPSVGQEPWSCKLVSAGFQSAAASSGLLTLRRTVQDQVRFLSSIAASKALCRSRCRQPFSGQNCGQKTSVPFVKVIFTSGPPPRTSWNRTDSDNREKQKGAHDLSCAPRLDGRKDAGNSGQKYLTRVNNRFSMEEIVSSAKAARLF